MIKIQIKSILGSVLFEHEKENNTLRDTITELLKKFKGEIIKGANLSNCDLSDLDFSNSQFDNSQFYNSKF
jgi:uncharacterized protein YjbI with pentapeptide repeats